MTETIQTPQEDTTEQTDKDIIATRKSCDADGTGLSHFILMDKEAAAGKEE